MFAWVKRKPMFAWVNGAVLNRPTVQVFNDEQTALDHAEKWIRERWSGEFPSTIHGEELLREFADKTGLLFFVCEAEVG
jgi:hypothetical protein